MRALTRLYIGAHVTVAGNDTKVWVCKDASGKYGKYDIIKIEPCRVLATDGRGIDVKCADGVIRLIDHEFENLPTVEYYL